MTTQVHITLETWHMTTKSLHNKGICLESRYPRYTCSSDFTFPLAEGAYGSLQLSTQPWICAPGKTMLTYPWKCTVLHCNHLGNTWKPLVLMTRHFDYCPSASESSAPVVSRCFPGGYNVKPYISRGRLALWLLACLHSDMLLFRFTVKISSHLTAPLDNLQC